MSEEKALLIIAENGPRLTNEGDVGAFLGDAWAADATMVAIPVANIAPEFFELRSGVLGAVVQKFVNYQLRLAIVGDVSAYVDGSNAFRDYVREANTGRDIWFVADMDELNERLTAD